MMGSKKLSTIYKELRAAIVQETENPIRALDREIRGAKRNPRAARKELKSLLLVRDILARAVADKPLQRRPSPARRTKRAV
jgi:hypothetical protein